MENTNENKKGKRKKIIIIGALAVIAITGALFFMSGGEESTNNAQIDADIIPIRTAISGYVKEVHFTDNQPVKKGQLLITVDETEFLTKVAQAEAALENAKANLDAVKNNANASRENALASVFSTETSQSSINSAKARLTKVQEDYKRVQNMYKEKAATKAEWDNATAELEVAQAQYDSALKMLKVSQSQSAGSQSQAMGQEAMVSLAQAMIRQREAELNLAKTQLDYATIEAPCDGIVTKRSIEVGQFITTGSPVCSVIDNTNLWITANFKETQIEHMQIGQPVTIKIDAFPKLKIKGKLNSFVGATGAKFSLLPPDNATGNFVKIVQRVPVKITIDQLSEKEAEVLFPGLSAYVSVKVN
ncbi:HlyD family secretion protein [Crocinitomicaceae bacterium CZZ-1]|uniref:HlyD family secretion protein n=1 Tax=Taishania pollutisoli TaxID=2766479 RepID=A0A8J6P5A5_9FLAO|nr:HlyD family secretion protein [Taishania pollutisoli]MBC9812047.1 HlyD family secretion protein [Taishania pollutisoli]MBX2949877.1 HlyD family secretion protein [Crocinitomicaceae bacterium]NGF74796.1 HlyD family secretion protein [Fluviicola sp. SGL-29]